MDSVSDCFTLISNMYPDDIIAEGNTCTITIKPNTEYGVHVLLQFDLEVTIEKTIKAKLINPKGMDEEEIIDFKRLVKQSVRDIQETSQDGALFNLVASVREKLSEYNDYLAHRCPICLETLGHARSICCLPYCFHKFHKVCAYRWFYGVGTGRRGSQQVKEIPKELPIPS